MDILTVRDMEKCVQAYKVSKEFFDSILALVEHLISGYNDSGYENVADGYTLYWWPYGEALFRSRPPCLIIRYVNAGGEVVEWAVGV